VEQACRDEGLSPGARLWLHQLVSAPVMDHLRTWMTTQLEEKRIEPNSDLGRAFNYMLKRWDKFTVFLRVPGAPIDNNICEQLLKMVVLYRKNSLFFRSERGAVVGDICMSLIRTATLHGQNPIDYLTALMTHCRAVAEAPAEWMPWNYRQTLAARTLSPAATADASAAVAASAESMTNTPLDAITASETVPSSPAVVQPPEPAASASPVAPSAPQAKRSSRSRRRPTQSTVPPPAFALFTLLCVVLPRFGVLCRPDLPIAQPAVLHDVAFGSRPVEQLTPSAEGCANATGPAAVAADSSIGEHSLPAPGCSSGAPTCPSQRAPP